MHTIKKIFVSIAILFVLLPFRGWGQTIGNMSQADYDVIKQMNIGKGNGSTAINRTNRSAYLELGDSLNSNKALLLPRGDTADVVFPIKGLIFFNLADSTIYQYRGTSGWEAFGSGGGGNLQATLDLGNTADKGILLSAAGAGDIGVQVENADGAGATIMVLDDVGLLSLATPTTSGILKPPASGSHQYLMPSADGTLALTSDLASYVPTTRTISTGYGLTGGGDLSANRTFLFDSSTVFPQLRNTLSYIGGSIASTQIAVGSAANTISGSSNLTFSGGTLAIGGVTPESGSGIEITSVGYSSQASWISVIRNSAAYSTTPSAGYFAKLKYNSAGDYGDMGGITWFKENNVDGEYGSQVAIYNRTNGSGLTAGFVINADQEILLGVADMGDAKLQLTPKTTSEEGIVIRLQPAATGNAWQAQSSAFASLGFLDANGLLYGVTGAFGSSTTPSTKAILDLGSTTKGFLPPRMTAAQRTAITSVPAALFTWDSDSSRYMGYDGANWRGIAWTGEAGAGGGGYTTFAQFVTETNWTTGYINGSGDYTALALGASGKVLTSNGASSAPTWETPTVPTLQQVTTAGYEITNPIYSSSDVGFNVVTSIPAGSVRAQIGKFSDNGFLTLGNTATYTGTIKADILSGFHNYQLPETGNSLDTLATKFDVRAGGGGGGLSDADYGDIVVSGTGTVMSIDAGVIVNADINASAAIAYSKLNLTGAILNADLAGSIAISKLSITGTPDGTKFLRDDGSWVTPGGSGTINSGTTGKPAYYVGATTLDDFAAVDYATSGTNVLITTQNTTDVGLEIKGISSQSANLLNISSSAGTGDLAIITAAGASRFTSLKIGTASTRKIELFANGEALFTSDVTATLQDPDAFDNTHQIYGDNNTRFLVSSGSGYDHRLVNVTGSLSAIYTGFVDGGGVIMETNQALNFGTNKTVKAIIAASGALKLTQYGSGTFTGTATKFLAVDASGNIIEENAPGGASTFAGLTDVNLTSITTEDFLKWNGTDWVNRSPSQVRTDLGLVISTNVQAYDADLTTWAGITPGSNVGTFLATASSANLRAALTDENGTGALLFSANTSAVFNTAVLDGAVTGTGVATAATASTLVKRDGDANVTANNWLGGYTTTATAAGTTTLTVSSTYLQYFTGSTTQTVTLPVTSTLTLGHQFVIVNNSTGNVTVNSSGANAVVVLAGGTSTVVTCILTSGTTAASWSSAYAGASFASGKKITWNNSITWTGTDGVTITLPTTSATMARTDAAQTFTGSQTFASEIITNTAVTASGNAATVAVTASLTTVTNNSAATLTITLTTASAVDGQVTTVRVLDFSAAAQTITWVNTENSSITAPTTSNGSTTLFLTVKFIYNSATSKWRCIGYA